MKKTLLAFMVTTSLLTACVPVVLVGAGTAAGAALGRDSRTLQTISDDTNIQFQANQKLASNPQTAQGTSITVTSFNRIVMLTGEVPSDAVRVAAEADVQKIPKVRRVYNLLKVSPQIGLIQLGDDARISTNIKARMAVAADLNSDNFKYVVNDRVVYLMGLATHAQAKLALDVIRNSSGVTKVVNLVEYSDDDTVEAAPTPAPVSTVTPGAAPSTPLPAPTTTTT